MSLKYLVDLRCKHLKEDPRATNQVNNQNRIKQYFCKGSLQVYDTKSFSPNCSPNRVCPFIVFLYYCHLSRHSPDGPPKDLEEDIQYVKSLQ